MSEVEDKSVPSDSAPKDEAKSSDKDRYQTEDWRKLADDDKQNGSMHKDRATRQSEGGDRDNEKGDRRDRNRGPRTGHRGGRGHRGGGRGRGRGGSRNDRNDRNGDRPQKKGRPQPELEETDDPEEIRKQVEFYFGDSNIFTDKHLLTQINGHENKPYSIKELCNFSRMRRFQPYTAVIAALKESEELNVIDNGKPGEELVQRKVPVPEGTSLDVSVNRSQREDLTLPRSIYAKGFGSETPTTQQDIMDFFDPYGPIKQVRLRRDERDGVFKGSVFVEFADEDSQQAFLNLESKPQWKDKDLQIMSKKQYVETKNKMLDNGRSGGQKRRRDDEDGGKEQDEAKKPKVEAQPEDVAKDQNGENGTKAVEQAEEKPAQEAVAES